MIELEAGDAVAEISAAAGGRLARLAIGGFDVLMTGDAEDDPIAWGCFPMVPWAGRLRHGRFEHEGQLFQVPVDLPPHAIHGTGYRSRWDVVDQGFDHAELTCRLDWPLGGRAHQHVLLAPDAIICVLSVVADHESMPVTIGWHPWFVKPDDDSLEFDIQHVTDDEQIPTGEVRIPGPRPWDDCFEGPHHPLELRYPGGLRVTVQSDTDHWVVFDRPAEATCLEPQSGPPNALNSGAATLLQPGEMLQHTMTIAWQR